MVNILIPASDVWDYYLKHQAEINDDDTLLGENPDCGISIYLRINDRDRPEICVLEDFFELDSEVVYNDWDCKDIVTKFYGEYLYDYMRNFFYGGDGGRFYDSDEDSELIRERELDLDDIISYMLSEIVPNIDEMKANEREIVDGLKDGICEMLYTDYGISVYRPMYLEDEDGKEYFYTHPYAEMDIE